MIARPRIRRRADLLAKFAAEHFYVESHQEIWRALSRLDAQNLQYDSNILHRLNPDIDIRDVEEIQESRPDVPEDLDHYVGLMRWDAVRAKATSGPIAELLEAIQNPLEKPSRVRVLATCVAAAFDGVAVTEGPRTAADLLRARSQTAHHKLATTLDPLDTALAGGLPVPALVSLVGPPGAGKTAVALHFADVASTTMRVVFLAVDDPAIAERIALRAGHDVDAEDYDVEAACAAVPAIVIADGSTTTVDEAIAALGSSPAMLIVDSVQTAHVDDRSRDPRAHVDAVYDACRRARSLGHVVVALSEASRGYYRSRKRGEQIEAIAAGKESSSIEYASDVLLVVRSEQGGSRSSTVEVTKARIRGAKRGALVRLTIDDQTRVTAEAVDDAAEEEEEEDEIVSHVVRLARETPGIGTRELRDAVRRVASCGSTRATAAIRAACDSGAVVASEGTRGAVRHRVPDDSIMAWAAERAPSRRGRRRGAANRGARHVMDLEDPTDV